MPKRTRLQWIGAFLKGGKEKPKKGPIELQREKRRAAEERAAVERDLKKKQEIFRMAQKVSRQKWFADLCQDRGLDTLETFIAYYNRLRGSERVIQKEFDARMDSVAAKKPFSKTGFYAKKIAALILKEHPR